MANFRAIAALALAVLAGCSAARSPQEAATDRELAHLAPMKTNPGYGGAVTGFDVEGTRLDMSVDLNQYESIDEDSADYLKVEALRRWKEAWTSENRGKHAKLTVRMLNYYGKPFLTESAKV